MPSRIVMSEAVSARCFTAPMALLTGRVALCLGVLALGLLAPFAPARAETCDDLWYARNEIYKAQGYCFRTQRGIAAFGNTGCQYDDAEQLPLSNAQRRTIADIQREERARRCPR